MTRQNDLGIPGIPYLKDGSLYDAKVAYHALVTALACVTGHWALSLTALRFSSIRCKDFTKDVSSGLGKPPVSKRCDNKRRALECDQDPLEGRGVCDVFWAQERQIC